MRHHSITLCLATFTLIILTACSGENNEVNDATSPASSKQAGPATTSDSTAAGASTDILTRGAAAWKQGNCTMCHGSDGGGNRFGPDLTDGRWNNCDGSVAGIRKILVRGIPKEKFANSSYAMAMPSATVLVSEQEKLDALAAYVKNLSTGASTNE